MKEPPAPPAEEAESADPFQASPRAPWGSRQGPGGTGRARKQRAAKKKAAKKQTVKRRGR